MTFHDLIRPVPADEAYGFDYLPKYFVRYPPGVHDDYGHTGYYFGTLRGAQYMARRAFRAKPGDWLSLRKDWTDRMLVD
jgi:hypothetical protein